ncbi:lysophospholipid acyltransferase family protein [Noviherbaspirillum sp. CPCC 100848]|uniref:Lysophospholipid acyltransferase family protein n=2 Tax=Noviherbaspirillum album TaxID=3080276 RepID=A0ABU6J3I7_9BURK|nr:lysophospholipid acyltransferase family protein [Noviherbaspirillum sp. CPCC 100848]
MNGLNTVNLAGKALSLRIVNLTRRIAGAAYGIYAWAIFVTLALPACLLIVLARQVAVRRRIARTAARLVFWSTRIPLSINGLDRLPAGPHILVVNHTSFLDAIVLTALLPSSPGYAFTARQQFRKQGLLWPVLGALGLLLLRAGDARHLSSNIEKIIGALKSGENVVMFPEGEFTPIAGLRRFHSGAFVAAAKAEVPVVIGALGGARTILRSGSWMPRRAPVAVDIGPVVHAAGMDHVTIAAMREEARRLMLPMTGEPDLNA